MNSNTPKPAISTWLAYFQLLRIGNVFTAMADVVMGFLLAQGSLQRWPSLLVLGASSTLLYAAGMVLNDVFDADLDAVERPERPIPAGQIRRQSGMRFGWGLLAVGATLPWLLPVLPGAMGMSRSGLLAVALAACIVAYDASTKRTLFGPLTMGACRGLNVLLGISIAAPSIGEQVWWGFPPHHLVVAAGIGIYVMGLTWFARSESQRSSMLPLILATLIMMGGLAVLCLLPSRLPEDWSEGLLGNRGEGTWMLLVGLVAFTILRRCGVAISDPSPQQVQLAVVHGLWSLIVIDASVVLGVCYWPFALIVLSLLIPTVVLSRWIRMT